MSTNKLGEILGNNLGIPTFGGFLRGARASLDLTQEKMAKKIKISKSSLCDIEKGRQRVSPVLALKIAKILKLSEIMAVQLALQDQLHKAKIKMVIKKVAWKNAA